MRLGDQKPMRFEVIDEQLAEAAFLAHRLLTNERWADRSRILGSRAHRSPAVAVRDLRLSGLVVAIHARAFDETFVDQKITAIAERNDASGGGAVFIRVDRLSIGPSSDLRVPFLELLCFGRKLGGPIILGKVVEFRQTALDARELLANFRRQRGRFRMDTPVFRGKAVIRVEHRPGPCPARPQLLSLGLQLLDGKPADQRRVIHEALVSGAEEIAPDGAAGSLVGGEADESAET
jgi:hypothetical protein